MMEIENLIRKRLLNMKVRNFFFILMSSHSQTFLLENVIKWITS